MTQTFENLQNLENFIKFSTTTTERNTLLELYNTMKISLIKEVHKYSIKYLEKCDRWNTYVKTETGRKELKAKTEAELYEKLWEWYGFTGTTLHDLFYEWFEYKRSLTSSENTLDRYRQYFQKYLSSSPLLHETVQKIELTELEKECNRLVTAFSMSYKTWQNLKTVLGGMYSYAKKKRYITADLMKDVSITVRFRQVTKKDSRTEVYSDPEYEAQKAYMYAKLSETADPVFAAVIFQDFTGLRIGELVALRWSDISETSVHVHSEEVYDRRTGKRTYHIEDHTKTYSSRYVALPPQAVDLLSGLDHSTEWVFSRKATGRVTSRQVTYQLERYAELNGLTVKRSHKTRKTYASRLFSHGVEPETVRKQLGHADLRTTFSYVFETKEDRSLAKIAAAV